MKQTKIEIVTDGKIENTEIKVNGEVVDMESIDYLIFSVRPRKKEVSFGGFMREFKNFLE